MAESGSIWRNKTIWLIPLLVLAGLGLSAWQPFGLSDLLDWGRLISDMPLVIAGILLVMVIMFTFGLPASFGLWLIAPFQPPVVSTLLLVIASVLGALGGYLVSRRLRGDWKPTGFSRKVVDLLEKRSDWATQMALRILPGFPHSVVNFAGGLLLLPLTIFLLSATIGLTIKWAVYATAVYGLVDAVESGDAIEASAIVPLIVLSALLIAGAVWRSRLQAA
ncbi:MAG: VTT domain-containing protein [Wenzhouxiangella sp.]